MQKREKQLLAVVVAMVALLGGNWLFGKLWSAHSTRVEALSTAETDGQKKDNQILAGKRAANRLSTWEKQSLPSDFEKARSLYSDWLRKTVADAGLEDPNVEPQLATPTMLKSGAARGTKSGPRPIVYQRLPYSVRGKATTEQLTKFLHAFYSSGHLHLIRSLKLTPQKDDKLDVTIGIDALALPTADRTDALANVPVETLPGGKLDAYNDAITKRKLFAAYTAPPPPKPPGDERPKPIDPAVDPARFAKVTAIVTDPVLVVWIHVETTGKLFKLAEGQEFDLGEQRHGKVHRIHLASRTVEVELNDEKLQVSLGQKLSEGKPLGNATASR